MAVSSETIQEWLVNIARNHDVRAFRNLFDCFYQDAYRTAYFFLDNKETAEELVSDVFLKIWDRRDTLGSVTQPRAYLVAAVKNQCLNHLKKHKPLFVSIDQASLGPDQSSDGPEPSVIWNDLEQALNQAIAQLPPRCRLIFQMVREQQLSYREVADSLGITPKTVEIQMGIALKRLNKLAQTLGETTLIGLFHLLLVNNL